MCSLYSLFSHALSPRPVLLLPLLVSLLSFCLSSPLALDIQSGCVFFIEMTLSSCASRGVVLSLFRSQFIPRLTLIPHCRPPPCDHVSLPIPPYLTVSIYSFPATFPRDSSSSLFLYPFNPQLSSAGSLSFSLPVSPSFLLYCRCSLLLFGFPSPSMFNLESVSPRVRTRAFVELISHRMCRQLSIVSTSIGLSVSRSTLECVALCFSSRSPCRLV